MCLGTRVTYIALPLFQAIPALLMFTFPVIWAS